MEPPPVQPYLWNEPAPAIPEPVVRPAAAPKQRIWLHVILFLLTIGSTWSIGGPVYSLSLLAILTAHEFGHYFTAKRHGVPASLPYFLPLPRYGLFGTLGAVIRMSPRIPNRRVLFDIAAAGPLAGLIVAIPVSYVGIAHSAIVQKTALRPGSMELGEPLLFQALGWLAHGKLGSNFDTALGPLGFAGWVGLFITALNLLPMGQLDGGHINHALFGRKSRYVSIAAFISLSSYCILTRNPSYVFLLVLLLFFGLQHPPSMDDEVPLGRARTIIGLLLAIVFITCFSLVPIKL
jgi:membrane-associated protease RseP (regulator of RpoE activity)